jgi:hypothetical protein
VPGQSYCNLAPCQKVRKNTWRREKYAEDADYRANQRDSTTAWLGTQGGAAAYYRAYRRRRRAQRGGLAADRAADRAPVGDPNAPGGGVARAESAAGAVLPERQPQAGSLGRSPSGSGANRPPETATATSANSDATEAKNVLVPGRYRLFRVDGANSDAIIVDLHVISGG